MLFIIIGSRTFEDFLRQQWVDIGIYHAGVDGRYLFSVTFLQQSFNLH